MIGCQDATPSAVANQLFGEMILANLIRAAEKIAKGEKK